MKRTIFTLKIITLTTLIILSGCEKKNTEAENTINDQISTVNTAKQIKVYQYANNTGMKFLSDEEYSKLPKADFSVLRKNSTAAKLSNSISSLSSTTSDGTYLISPSSGNQGGEGSCVAWAVGYSAMGILTFPKLNYNQNSIRSPEYIYNQIKVNGCAGGSYIIDALNLIKNQGVCSWNLMPYNDTECSTMPNQLQRNDAANYKSTSFGTLNPKDVSSIKQAISLGWPVVVGFDVSTQFDNMWSNGGVWKTNSTQNRGGHATCIVGYDESRNMFKVQNQWGSFGGDGAGYFWVTYSLVNSGCFKEAYVIYTNVSSTPLSLLGSKDICATENYTIPNLPANSSVIWSATPSGIVNISANGNSATVTKLTDGVFNLQATTISSAGTSVLMLNNIKSGIVAPTFIDGTRTKYAPNSSYNFSSDGTDWEIIGGTIIGGQGTNGIVVETNSSGQLRINVRRVNSCGTSPYIYSGGRIDPNLPPI
ncbi:C1 family peptidase [Sphingobacterium kitahiroshimense]|uniref:C1 family peptidase n=1 Tax=Sphingobacterium kitahiroshimense TaxID=470446 RepID=A0ABV0BZV3_9SPHI